VDQRFKKGSLLHGVAGRLVSTLIATSLMLLILGLRLSMMGFP
jgi:hypothetical protein